MVKDLTSSKELPYSTEAEKAVLGGIMLKNDAWDLVAVKVQEDAVPHIVVAIASPTGLDVKSIIPIVDTPIMLIATQIPLPKKNNKTVIKKIVNKISGIRFI